MLKGFSSPFRRQVARVLCWSGRSAGTWAFQETPNPNVWKFQSDTGVPKSTKSQLLEVPGVQDVLVHEGLSGTWLAITRQSGTQWQVLAPQLKDFLQSLPDTEAEQQVDDSTILDATDATEILEVLEHRIRPSVQEDGGDVQLKSWDRSTGEVVLCLQGACRGCPQSAVTLQESILKTLQHFVPDVTSVRSEEERNDCTDPTADLPWSHSGAPAKQQIQQLVMEGTPIFSTFAGTKVEGAKLRRIAFMSKIRLEGRTPEHIFVTCSDCKAKRTVEDPQDLLRADKGNATGNAAVAICPTCCVLITP